MPIEIARLIHVLAPIAIARTPPRNAASEQADRVAGFNFKRRIK